MFFNLLTLIAGLFANINTPFIKNFLIRQFIKYYRVNMKEALIEDPTAYSSFNEFFIRALKPDQRPLQHAAIISPVDGCISEMGYIQSGQLLQAKNRYYTVSKLIGENEKIKTPFELGAFATLYLSPKDYHRVHMPIDGLLLQTTYIPGRLLSVNPVSVNRNPNLFAENERLVALFKTPLGLMNLIMVGATIVGKIATVWTGELTRKRTSYTIDHTKEEHQVRLKQGEELGYFKLGSTVILLFEDAEKVKWLADIQSGNPIKLGERFTE